MSKYFLAFGAVVLFLLVLFSGCIGCDEEALSKEWWITEDWSGVIYNGSVSVSILFPYGSDEKIFILPTIVADNEYHYVSKVIILNNGTLYEKIEFWYEGELSLSKCNETGYEIQRLSIGEEPDTDDVSIKIFINENSTENKNYIVLSNDSIGQILTLDTLLAPRDKITLYFYVKTYGKVISGEYQNLFQMHVAAAASSGPVFNPEFELFEIKSNELIFNLDFVLVLSSDVSLGDIEISFPNCPLCSSITYSPISPHKSNYHLGINLKVNGNPDLYPFDKYDGVIELKAVNGKNAKYINASLKGYSYSKRTADWCITLYAKGNRIYFNFERNETVNFLN